MIKKYPFWLCTILAMISFVAIYPLSATPMAYYVLGFVALSIIGFAAVLYYTLTKSFTQTNVPRFICFIVITALPHIVFSLLTYGSWVCLGISVLVIILLLLNKKKFPQN
ncbi:MAG: hypothetical protein ACRDDX_02205 [Cellulosilyticaceae bacterium]